MHKLDVSWNHSFFLQCFYDQVEQEVASIKNFKPSGADMIHSNTQGYRACTLAAPCAGGKNGGGGHK